MRGKAGAGVVVWMAGAVACSGPPSDSTTPAGGTGSAAVARPAAPLTDADPDAVHMPAVPTGEIRITYACSHSAKPFGSKHWSQTTIFDLTSGRAVVDRSEGDDDDPDATRSTHNETVLPPARVTAIRAALDKVLAGGPYKPEHPVPEGVVCTLTLWVPGEKAFFTIDKATTAQPDAVSALVKDLGI